MGLRSLLKEIALISRFCGAVAVSYYSKLDEHGNETNPITITAIEKLIAAGCTTNIHYVLSKESIKDAIRRLHNGLFPEGINAVIFLLYKPVGLARKSKTLSIDDPEYLEFLQLINEKGFPFKIGLDSCQAPAINMFCSSITPDAIEFCDAARFSMYIDCNMTAFPCSFGHDHLQYGVDLNTCSIKQAWNSDQFEWFRQTQSLHCQNCSYNSKGCRTCALELGLNMCKNVKAPIYLSF